MRTGPVRRRLRPDGFGISVVAGTHERAYLTLSLLVVIRASYAVMSYRWKTFFFWVMVSGQRCFT
jgi:hypothetical protein